jgi:hypothetical protein
MGDERKPDHGAQQRLRPRRQCLIKRTQVREDERSRVRHSVMIRAVVSVALAGLMLRKSATNVLPTG